MAESNEDLNDKVLSDDDPLDINELASLNEDITDEFIEQLQNQITAGVKSNNDGDLFEEVQNKESDADNDTDDPFLKKYKAKLNKKDEPEVKTAVTAPEAEKPVEKEAEAEVAGPESVAPSVEQQDVPVQEIPPETEADENKEVVSIGDITEKPLTKELAAYNNNLDYLDNNVKYAKYVIYIDPENQEFIDSLTVKERKNLINRILKEQDAIALTKRRLGKAQTIITHAIIAILTIVLAIPCIYWAINASLETTIDNYRASQSIFEQLYKEKGKIQTNRLK